MIRIVICSFAILLLPHFFYSPVVAYATTLSVSPPLFRVRLKPNETWKSVVRFTTQQPSSRLNVRIVHLQTKNGEITGSNKLTPLFDVNEAEKKHSLAGWITVGEAQNGEIPFAITIPPDAPSGDHYAAMLISEASTDDIGVTAIGTTAMLSSTFFVTVAGDVFEKGLLREFSTSRLFFEDAADIAFQLHVENAGNTHLRPDGSIVLVNWFGAERVQAPLDSLGTIFPSQIKTIVVDIPEFERRWFDFGFYSATLRLVLGDTQYLRRDVRFFLLPSKAHMFIIDVVTIFFMIFFFVTKRYIQKRISKTK